METKYSLVGTLILPNCLLFSCIRATLSCVLFNQRSGNKDAVLDAWIMFLFSTIQFSAGVTLEFILRILQHSESHLADWIHQTEACFVGLQRLRHPCCPAGLMTRMPWSCLDWSKQSPKWKPDTHTEIWAMLTTVDGTATALWEDPHKCKCRCKFRCFVF